MNTLLKESVITQSGISSLTAIQKASAVICQRKLASALVEESTNLLNKPDFQSIKCTGDLEALTQALRKELIDYPYLMQDIQSLLQHFFTVVPTESVRFSFMAVRNGMCKKFHTDVTDYRLLCTYKGVGTQLIPSECVGDGNSVVNKSDIITLKEGEIILFRGAISATDEFPPLIHRSPAVEHEHEHRLLLRLDTNITAWE